MYSTRTIRRPRGLGAALFGALLLLPVGASAQKGKGSAKLQQLTAGGPTLKYEQFRRKIELEVAEKREQQIAGIKRLLDLGPAEREIPDLEFRLAELYFEKSQFFFFRAQEAEERATLAKSDGEKDERMAEKKRHNDESNNWLQAALDLYKSIRDKFPKYERMPEVLFALGQSYWNQGKFEQAIEVYADLIRNFKDSPLVSEAWLAFGEYYFNENDVNKALKSYEKAAEDKRSRVYGFALYKQAWCYYNLSEWDQALRKFKATVLYSQVAADVSGENRLALGREAQKDYVRTYAHVGDPGRAKFQFADLVGIDECNQAGCFALLDQLAGLWYDGGSFEEAAAIYRQLIVLDPKSTRNAFYQGRIVDLVSRGGDKKRTTHETRALVEIYKALEALVAQAKGNTEADRKAREDAEEARTLAETTIRRLAQLWNQEAKKTRISATYEHAMVMYTDYLALFPASKFAYEMKFQLGDLYYKLERFDEAAKAYEATVLADPKGQYLVEAANDNILAVEEHIKDLGLKRPKDPEPNAPIHPEKKRLIDACDRYVKLVPPEKADKLVAVKLKAARLYYDYRHDEEALARFDRLVMEHPESDQAEVAANLVADIYNAREDWPRLYESSTRYARNETLVKGRAKLLADLTRYGEYAKFKLVSILEARVKNERGDLRLVAQGYEEFYREFPQSDNADEALFNASVAYDKAGQKDKADDLRRRLLAEYPTSPLTADVAFYVAKQYEERTQFEEAAKGFLEFARKFPGDPRARDALFNAAVFFAGVGNVATSTKLREEYLKSFGRAKGGEKEAAAIYWSIARDLDRAGKWREAADRYAEYAKNFPDTVEFWDALWREAELRRERLRLGSKADKIEGEILGTYRAWKRRGREPPANAKRYASLVAFQQVDGEFGKYQKLRVETPNLSNPKPFQKSLEEKAKGRDRVIKTYTGIVTEYQQAESTIAALFRIAQSYEEFVRALTSVPCPRGVGEEVCDLIRNGIEEKAGPARDAAYQGYVACVEKSNQLNVFTEYSTRCVKALETLAPAAYPQIVEMGADYVAPRTLEAMSSHGLILQFDGYAVARQAQAQSELRGEEGGR